MIFLELKGRSFQNEETRFDFVFGGNCRPS